MKVNDSHEMSSYFLWKRKKKTIKMPCATVVTGTFRVMDLLKHRADHFPKGGYSSRREFAYLVHESLLTMGFTSK